METAQKRPVGRPRKVVTPEVQLRKFPWRQVSMMVVCTITTLVFVLAVHIGPFELYVGMLLLGVFFFVWSVFMINQMDAI